MVCPGLIPATVFHFLSDFTGGVPFLLVHAWQTIYLQSHVDWRADSLRSAQVCVTPVYVTGISEVSRASVGCMGHSCLSLLPDGADYFGSV